MTSSVFNSSLSCCTLLLFPDIETELDNQIGQVLGGLCNFRSAIVRERYDKQSTNNKSSTDSKLKHLQKGMS